MKKLERLFEAILREEHLREMSSPTSLRLANVFIGVLKSLGISEKEGISDEKLEKASNQTIDRFGARTTVSLNFKFSEEEQKTKNPRKAYIQNFATFVANGIGFLAKPFQVFIERLKTILQFST